jgi:hypothetical protein
MINDISSEFDSEEIYLFNDSSIETAPPSWLIQDMLKFSNNDEKSNVLLLETEKQKESNKRKENRRLRKERYENGTLIDLEIKKAKDLLCYSNFGDEAKKSPRFNKLTNNPPSRPQTPRATNQSPRNIISQTHKNGLDLPNPPNTTILLNIIQNRCDKLLEKVKHNKNIRLKLKQKENEKQTNLIHSFKPVTIIEAEPEPSNIELNVDDSILVKADDIGKDYDPVLWGVRTLDIKEEIEIANQRMKKLLILTLYNVFLEKRFNIINSTRKFKLKRACFIIGKLFMKYREKKKYNKFYQSFRIPVSFIMSIRRFKKSKSIKIIKWFLSIKNTNKDFQVAVSKFFKKIRYCQKIIRSFLVINRARINLIHIFWKRFEKKFIKLYSNKVEKNDILAQQQLNDRIMKDNKKLTHKRWDKTHTKVINLLTTTDQTLSKFENAKLGWYYEVRFLLIKIILLFFNFF